MWSGCEGEQVGAGLRGGAGPLEKERLTDGGSGGLGEDGASRPPPPPATTEVTYWANWGDNVGEDEEGWGVAHTQICNLTRRTMDVVLPESVMQTRRATTNLNCSRVRPKMEEFSSGWIQSTSSAFFSEAMDQIQDLRKRKSRQLWLVEWWRWIRAHATIMNEYNR